MKVLVFLILLLTLCFTRDLIFSSKEWYNWASAGRKVWVDPANNGRVWWEIFDYSETCGGKTGTICTDKVSDITSPGENYLLCDAFNACDGYVYSASDEGFESQSLSSFVPDDTCILRLFNRGSKSHEIVLKDAKAQNMDVYMYSQNVEDSYNFTFQGLIDAENTGETHLVIEENLPVYFVIVPVKAENHLEFSYKAVHSRKDQTLLTLIITFGSIGAFLFLICWFCGIIRYRRRKYGPKPNQNLPKFNLFIDPEEESQFATNNSPASRYTQRDSVNNPESLFSANGEVNNESHSTMPGYAALQRNLEPQNDLLLNFSEDVSSTTESGDKNGGFIPEPEEYTSKKSHI